MGQNQSKRGNKKKASKTFLPFKPISFWSKSGIFLFCQSKESLWRFGMTWWMGPDKKREIAFEIQFSTLSSRRCNAGQPKTNPWSLHCIGTKDLIDMLSLARPPVAHYISQSLLFKPKERKYIFRVECEDVWVWPSVDGLVGLLRDLERAPHRGQRLRRPQGKDSRLRETEQCGPGHGKRKSFFLDRDLVRESQLAFC